MADTKEVETKAEKAVEADAEETVSKQEYTLLVNEYNRIGAAFKKLVDFCANKYTEELVTNLFNEVDKELKK